ncbi:uncharacterized protein LOC121056731 isoform X2 [Oryza brachyantha]|uniref:uncharacterized protein LOC121056731 isoform X2 n=1 Tax=Oryza brachyantha TaxID=4533 RepID=UPI001ADAE6C8|nr:uncharacterized protein LOC121056731 isoform X2 [Oryza brachyantha]
MPPPSPGAGSCLRSAQDTAPSRPKTVPLPSAGRCRRCPTQDATPAWPRTTPAPPQLREICGGMRERGRGHGHGAAAGRRLVAVADVDDQGEEHEEQGAEADGEGDQRHRPHAAGASPRRQAQEEAHLQPVDDHG